MKKVVVLLIVSFLLLTGCINSEKQVASENNIVKENLWNVWGNGNSCRALVTEIVDGDTIKVKIKNREYVVNLIGIEAKSPDTPEGKAAIEYLTSLILNKTVTLEKDIIGANDKGEIWAYVWLKTPKSFSTCDYEPIDKPYVNREAITLMVNALLQSQGLTQTSTIEPNVKHSYLLTQLQLVAREKKMGMWK